MSPALTMVTEPSRTVCILHSGGEQERNFIQHIRMTLSTCVNISNKLDIHFTQHRDDQKQHKATHVHMNAETYKKKNNNVIVLICKDFFETMWASPHKRNLVKLITTMKNCVHVWLDVNEDEVRRYSTILLRKDLNFARITVDELVNDVGKSSSDSQILLIKSLLMKMNTKSNSLSNYAVDDEVEDMRVKYLESFPSLPNPSL